MQLPRILQGRVAYPSLTGSRRGLSRNSRHRLRLGRMDARRHGHENGESKRQHRGRDSARANLRR